MEFCDATGESNSKEQGPQLHPFRSSNISKICQDLEETWEGFACQPDQLPLYKMRDKNGKLTYLRESRSEELQQPLETEDPQPSLDEHPEHDEDIQYVSTENIDKYTELGISEDQQGATSQDNCEDQQGDTTLEVILEDLRADLKMAENITSDNDVDSDVVLDNETPSQKNIMDDSNMQETSFCDKDCPVEPPSKRRKLQSQNKHRTIQSKTAKALELVLGKTPEVSEIDRLKQTVSKNPKAHFYRKKT